jgi:hypothetical protein
MKRKLCTVFDVMETGLELQFDIFPQKHKKHKLKTILFLGGRLNVPEGSGSNTDLLAESLN